MLSDIWAVGDLKFLYPLRPHWKNTTRGHFYNDFKMEAKFEDVSIFHCVVPNLPIRTCSTSKSMFLRMENV